MKKKSEWPKTEHDVLRDLLKAYKLSKMWARSKVAVTSKKRQEILANAKALTAPCSEIFHVSINALRLFLTPNPRPQVRSILCKTNHRSIKCSLCWNKNYTAPIWTRSVDRYALKSGGYKKIHVALTEK